MNNVLRILRLALPNIVPSVLRVEHRRGNADGLHELADVKTLFVLGAQVAKQTRFANGDTYLLFSLLAGRRVSIENRQHDARVGYRVAPTANETSLSIEDARTDCGVRTVRHAVDARIGDLRVRVTRSSEANRRHKVSVESASLSSHPN